MKKGDYIKIIEHNITDSHLWYFNEIKGSILAKTSDGIKVYNENMIFQKEILGCYSPHGR